SKFMPYYIHTELESEVEIDQTNLFGMLAINPKFAITYDLPVWKEVDASGFEGFDSLASGNLPPLGVLPGGGGGVPFMDIPSDGTQDGIGDLGLRFFFKPDAIQFEKSSHMFGFEMTLPTATETILGGNNWVLSPMYVYVRDVKLLSPGFFALMNFYDHDIAEDGDDGSDVSKFRGRWFLMQPLSKPGPKLTDGLYLLPELQPVYDWERDEDEFSLWLAPEFGKMLPWGAAYFKPGFGIIKDSDSDRDWTLELGVRYFF
ncbi:MAG: hypothetical protein ACR2QW_12765, partial [bacterium]